MLIIILEHFNGTAYFVLLCIDALYLHNESFHVELEYNTACIVGYFYRPALGYKKWLKLSDRDLQTRNIPFKLV